jgi:glycosyltransferase involved in cell wall biosynthesis
MEIILVNDGSEDGSETIMGQYRERSSNIICIKQKNAGAGAARNAGLARASGEYIGFVDADDYVEPSMYEKMYRIAEETGAGLVECAYLQEFPHKVIAKTVRPYAAEDMLVNTRFSAWNKLIRREVLKAGNVLFPEKLNYEDSEFVCKLAPFVRGAAVINEPLYHYMQRSGSRYRSFDEGVRDIYKIYENIRRFYKERNIYDEYKDRLEYIHIASRLGGSFFRILNIRDRKTRRKILRENWRDLIQNYPDWRRNHILRKDNSLRGIYFKTINHFSYNLYAAIWRLV